MGLDHDGIPIDAEADTAYVALSGEAVAGTDGVLIDRDAAGRPVGIEVPSLSRRVGAGDPRSYLRGLIDGLTAPRRHAAE
jgi:uncharacterized protein YuzE